MATPTENDRTWRLYGWTDDPAEDAEHWAALGYDEDDED